MADKDGTNTLLLIVGIAAGAIILWKIIEGLSDGTAGGNKTTTLGNEYSVGSDGSLTINFHGAQQTFALTSPNGPTGQTMQSLLNSGWTYADITDMIVMREENVFNTNP